MEKWSHVEIFYSGDEYYRSLIEAIRHAQKSITVETYIFDIDSFTETVLKELAEARVRGCDVKIVVDGFGTYAWIPQLRSFCQKHHIDLKVFQPLPSPLAWIFRYFWALSKYFKRFNRRTHRKITIVDEKRAYLGSLNFTKHHVGPQSWRDTGVCVEGPLVARLSIAFHITYLRTIHRGLLGLLARFQWNPSVDPATSLLRLNTTQRMRRRLYLDLLRRLNTAEKRIYITTAYFLPKRKILRALTRAAKRGVDVRILIPGKSDVPLVKWAAFNIIHLLQKKGVKLYEYKKSILHAKTMILDDTVFVGSFNLNHRSLIHDLEVEVILPGAKSCESMLKQWEIDLSHSQEMTVEDYTASTFLGRVFYKLAFRLRYML
ncbi:Cardiolipin synthase [compost metagenome]